MSSARTARVWTITVAVTVAVVATQMPVDARLHEEDIKLSGCLVRGEEGGYLLTNAPGDPAWQRSVDSTVAPSTVGTTGAFATIFYWLKDDDELREHVGHMVEVEGDFDGDIEDGAIRIDRKENWTEIRVKADGRDLRARVPNASIAPGPAGNRRETKILVRKVDVEHVRMIAAGCQP